MKYTKQLSNMVLVNKASSKWCMGVGYTDHNKACPTDSHPLPEIDKLVDNLVEYKVLSFMDTYSKYNQILMHDKYWNKITFMNEHANYKYNNAFPIEKCWCNILEDDE